MPEAKKLATHKTCALKWKFGTESVVYSGAQKFIAEFPQTYHLAGQKVHC